MCIRDSNKEHWTITRVWYCLRLEDYIRRIVARIGAGIVFLCIIIKEKSAGIFWELKPLTVRSLWGAPAPVTLSIKKVG